MLSNFSCFGMFCPLLTGGFHGILEFSTRDFEVLSWFLELGQDRTYVLFLPLFCFLQCFGFTLTDSYR